MTELFAAELERAAAHTRPVLERVPEGREDWKPHERSMPMGYLSSLVATLPGWVTLMIKQDELDLQPVGKPPVRTQVLKTNRELLAAFDDAVASARDSLATTTEAHLLTPWRLLFGGNVASEDPRHIVLRDGVFNHLAHHRGQLTVYLRLNEAPVPGIYGPSADDARF